MKLPPHQALVAPGKWPVIGESGPRRDPSPWRVEVAGLVARPRSWSLDELRALPPVERVLDIHCVTRWSKPAARFGGVPLRALLEACAPFPAARFLSFLARSERKHSTSLPLADALELDTLVALTFEGEPLAESHGGPVRTVVPGRYFYKSLKWLEKVEVLERDRLGFWESEYGYHNLADPWKEQRYVVPEMDRREVAALLAGRDLSRRHLLSVEAGGLDLAGLEATDAQLRNASFAEAKLPGARFDRANLSNAHFVGADLRGASFRDADLEGADLRGADLRGADFRGASLFGVTFCAEPGDVDGWDRASIDATTVIEPAQVERLSLVQQRFLEERS
jgi:hypothetical protein